MDAALVPAKNPGCQVPARRGAEAPPEAMRRAAWMGGLAVILPALALSAPIPFVWQQIFWGPVRWLAHFMPWTTASLLWASGVFLMPALLALPVSWLARRVVRGQDAVHPDQGRAAAAGACMAATLATALVILGKNLVILEIDWIGPQVLAAALGVGILGAGVFSATRTREGRPGRIPALYQGLATCGLTAPLLLLAGLAWGLVALAFPGLSPLALAAALGLGAGSIPALVVALPLLLPVTLAASRLARRVFPDARPGVLRAGVALPSLVALLFLTWPALTHLGALSATNLGILALAWGLGLGTHALAARLALPAREGPRQLEAHAGVADG